MNVFYGPAHSGPTLKYSECHVTRQGLGSGGGRRIPAARVEVRRNFGILPAVFSRGFAETFPDGAADWTTAF